MKTKYQLCILPLLFCCLHVYSQEPKIPRLLEQANKLQQKKLDVKHTVYPREYVAWCLTDSDTIDHQFHRYVRYVAIPPGNALGVEQVSFIANSVFSRTSNKYRAVSLAGGRLARIELNRFVPDAQELELFLKQYELLSERDTFFSSAFEVGPKALTSLAAGDEVEVTFSDGSVKVATFVRFQGQDLVVQLSTGNQIVVGQKFARAALKNVAAGGHLDTHGALLRARLGTNVPIMELSEFVAMTFSTINRGIYYELRGITPSTDPNVTDLDLWLRRFGSSLKTIEELSAQSKVLVLRSEVTKRTRIVVMFYAPSTKPDVGPALITMTFDSAEEEFDDNADPIRNIADFDDRNKKKYFAIEVIAIMPNGMLEYALFDKQLKLQRSVPDIVARDFEAPHDAGTNRIFSGLSCARCHDKPPADPGAANLILNSGWQTLSNDALLFAKNGPNILGDKALPDSVLGEDLSKLEDQFGGDPSTPINLARVTYSTANFQVTTKETWQVIQALGDSYHHYTDEIVTAQSACRDLGYEVVREDAPAFLQELLIPVDKPTNQIVKGNQVRGVGEDGALVILMLGRSVTPPQWRLIRKHAMLRAFIKESSVNVADQNDFDTSGVKLEVKTLTE